VESPLPRWLPGPTAGVSLNERRERVPADEQAVWPLASGSSSVLALTAIESSVAVAPNLARLEQLVGDHRLMPAAGRLTRPPTCSTCKLWLL